MGISNTHFINENDCQRNSSLHQKHLAEGTEKENDYHIQRISILTSTPNCYIILPVIWAEGLDLIQVSMIYQ